MERKIEHFGENLRRIRKARGLTQEGLAEASQVAYSYLVKLENGLDTPGIDTALKLCNTLQAPLDFFLQAEGYRCLTTYANSFMVQEMERLDGEKFALLSQALSVMLELFQGETGENTKTEKRL